jgi:ribosomal protein S18 acetylase RimI-like enzyme
MTSNLHVRRYEPGDENAVWQVHDAAFRASSVEFIPDVDRHLRRIPESFLDAGGEFLVGTLDAADAGEGAYGQPGERLVACGGFQPADEAENAARIRSVRVHPESQRRGFGRTIVTELEDRARNRGFERVVLHTGEDMTAARGLYESLSYEQTGREYVEVIDSYQVHFEKRL